jgi:hypothetical protein
MQHAAAQCTCTLQQSTNCPSEGVQCTANSGAYKAHLRRNQGAKDVALCKGRWALDELQCSVEPQPAHADAPGAQVQQPSCCRAPEVRKQVAGLPGLHVQERQPVGPLTVRNLVQVPAGLLQGCCDLDAAADVFGLLALAVLARLWEGVLKGGDAARVEDLVLQPWRGGVAPEEEEGCYTGCP